MDFVVPREYRREIKEGEKLNHCIDLARELTECLNIKVTVVLIRVESREIISKNQKKRLTRRKI